MYRSVCYSVCYTPNNLAENAEAAPLGFVWKCLWPQAKVDPTVELFHKSTYTHTPYTPRKQGCPFTSFGWKKKYISISGPVQIHHCKHCACECVRVCGVYVCVERGDGGLVNRPIESLTTGWPLHLVTVTAGSTRRQTVCNTDRTPLCV